MRVISNILWIILGGLIIAIGWALIGLVLCVTIIGIPLGLQAFKMAGLTLTPFGKTVRYGGGVGSTLANIIWVVLVGFWMALSYVGAGLLNCITIIGIPFGIQSFKMAKLALWPFGADIVSLLASGSQASYGGLPIPFLPQDKKRSSRRHPIRPSPRACASGRDAYKNRHCSRCR